MKRKDILIGLMLAIFIALFLSPFASTWPDGLERIAASKGFLEKGEEKNMIPSPLPDYKFPGFKNEKLATSLSGVLGALVLFGLGCGIACLLRKRKSDHETRIH